MPVPILKQGDLLIVSMPSTLTDRELILLKDELAEKAGRARSRATVIDVSALDVIDSFAARTLRGIAEILRLRGTETVIVGIQPEVALAMVQLGLTLEGVATALDLEDSMEQLTARREEAGPGGR